MAICQYFPPDWGGGSRRVENAIKGLVKRNHKVEVITAFPHYPHGKIPKKFGKKSFVIENIGGIKVTRVWVPPIPHYGFIRRILMYAVFAFSSISALLQIKTPDIIWAANPNVFSSFPAFFLNLLTKARIVRNVDDLWPEGAIEQGIMTSGFSVKIGRFLAKLSYKLCSALTPISQTIRNEIIRNYHIHPNKIHVVEVGVDTELFHPIPSENVKTNSVTAQTFLIMYSGNLGGGYNFDYLLKVAEKLSNYETIKFVIRGFGEKEKELRRKVNEMGLQNVLISSEFLPLSSLVKLLNSADILFLPMLPMKAHLAGIPTKLFEYMALGKTVLSCSEGDVAKLIELAQCGISVSPRHPDEAVKIILKLQSNPELLEKMGSQGRTYASKHLSIKNIGYKLEKIFYSVLGH